MKSSGNPGRRLWAATGTGALVLVAVVLGIVAMSSAATSKSKSKPRSQTLQVAKGTLRGPSGDKSEPIVVSAKGQAVYELSPETTHRLLCTKANGCFSVWIPVKVKSTHVSKASGVKGHVGTFRRDGFIQLTLNGHPLYTFVEDGGKRDAAAGDGIHSFNGIWHVFAEGKATMPAGPGSSAPSPAPPVYPPSTTSTSGSPAPPVYPPTSTSSSETSTSSSTTSSATTTSPYWG